MASEWKLKVSLKSPESLAQLLLFFFSKCHFVLGKGNNNAPSESVTMRTQPNLSVGQLGVRDQGTFGFLFVLNTSLDTLGHLLFSKREVVVMGKYGFNRKLFWVTLTNCPQRPLVWYEGQERRSSTPVCSWSASRWYLRCSLGFSSLLLPLDTRCSSVCLSLAFFLVSSVGLCGWCHQDLSLASAQSTFTFS